MNYKMIGYTLGWILLFEAGFLLVPLITAISFAEWSTLWAILISLAICGAVGFLLILLKPKIKTLYAREGLVIVALSWVFLSAFGALPFYISREIPAYIDAFFETASGFTTTGSSILTNVEAMPSSLLMWRSFTHWVGGMGVLVFIMAFLPLSGAQNLHIMRAESPGPTVSKLVPKMRTTALILYLIYFVLTVIMFIILLFDSGSDSLSGEPMTVFEALNTAFATAGTGGFSTKANGIAGFSSYVQIVVTVFMLVFSVNFSSYYLVLKRRFKDAFNLEVRTFLIIVLIATVTVAVNIHYSEYSPEQIGKLTAVNGTEYVEGEGYSLGDSFKQAAFNVASIISTTGFGTENFVAWPELSQIILMLVMFIGACAGSTGGGFKISRVLILLKGAARELKAAIHPRQVKKITIDERPVDDEVVRSVNSYIAVYLIMLAVSLILISIDPFVTDLTTGISSVLTTLNNVGPGFGAVGPTSNFAGYNAFSKLVLSFNMIAGRLELIPMLIMFAPSTWRKN